MLQTKMTDDWWGRYNIVNQEGQTVLQDASFDPLNESHQKAVEDAEKLLKALQQLKNLDGEYGWTCVDRQSKQRTEDCDTCATRG